MSGPARSRAWWAALALVVLASVAGVPRIGAETSPAPVPAPVPAAGLSIAAASDLRPAMAELVATFSADDPDERVTVTYGSSGSFFAQISNGAPFDVLFSADLEYPRRLEEAGQAAPGSTRAFARGRIVVWVRDGSPIDVAGLGLGAVLHPAVERVAIANPAHAPYGRAAQAALGSAGLWEAVRPRIVLGENVSQAAQFVESAAADVGVIALSLALAPRLDRAGRFALVADELYPPIEQGAVVLETAGERAAAAQAFLDHVLGPEGQAILQRHGFLPPEA